MRVNIWLLRIVWVTLPVAAGDAASSVVAGFARAPAITVQVVLWAGWGLGLVALAVPGPVTITAVRLLAWLGAGTTLVAGLGTDTPRRELLLALGTIGLAAVLSATPTFARACLQQVAYGTEERFPLRTPPALFLGILPAAVTLVGAGALAGPLLVASGHLGAGVPTWAAGWVAAGWTIRSLHTLAGRFLVLVPAGLVIADPLTLTDPVLCTRDRVGALTPLDPRRPPPPASLDLRLGAGSGSLLVEVDPPLETPVRVRRRVELRPAGGLIVACATPRALLAAAAAHRLPVQVAPAPGRAR